MTIAQFKDRETKGSKLDLNMLRFQQMPLTPQGGYRGKTDIQIRTLTAIKHHPETDNLTLREQQKKDRMAAHARRFRINREDRLKKLLTTHEKFSIRNVAKCLVMTHEAARQAIRQWVQDGSIVDTKEYGATGESIYAKVGYVPKSVLKRRIAHSNGQTPAENNKVRAKELSLQRLKTTFLEDKRLNSADVYDRLGTMPKSTKQSIIKKWKEHEFIHNVGKTGNAIIWEVV